MSPKRILPPPHGIEELPPPPSFGWYGDTDELTMGEIDEIVRVSGLSMKELGGPLLLAYAAVAYARREKRELYPWSCVTLLRGSDLTFSLDDDDDTDRLEQAAEQAVQDGTEPPDPV